MSAAPSIPRPSWAAILWTIAAATIVHGVVHALRGERDLATTAVFGFALGALPLLSGLRGRGFQSVLAEPLLVGLLTAIAAVAWEFTFLPVTVGVAFALRWLLVPLFELLGIQYVSPHAVALLGLAIVALAIGGTAGRLRTLIGVEWLKLTRGKLLRVGLAVAAIATLLVSILHTPVKEETTGWTQAATSLGVGFWTAEILLFVLGAVAIAGEISQGTMKMILPHAYRRAEWISAKAIVLLFAACLFTLVVCLVGIGHTAIDAGLGDVTREAPAGFGEENTVEVFETADVMRSRLIDTVSASAASLAASGVIGLLLSCVFGGLVAALSASFLLFAVLKTGKAFLGLEAGTLSMIYAHYPDELRRLTEQFGRAFSDSWIETLLPDGLQLAMLTGGVALLIALRMFGRRDLHG